MMETTVSARGSSRSVRYGPGECCPDAPGSDHEIGGAQGTVKGRFKIDGPKFAANGLFAPGWRCKLHRMREAKC